MRAGSGSGLSNVAPFPAAALAFLWEFDAQHVLVSTNDTYTSRDPLKRTATGLAATKPTYSADPGESAPTNDRRNVEFGAGDMITADDAAAVFAPLHDGSGFRIGLCCIPQDGMLWTTRTTGRGTTLSMSSGVLTLVVDDGTTEVVDLDLDIGGGAGTPAPDGVIVNIWATIGSDFARIEAADLTSEATGVTFGSGAPEQTLSFGEGCGRLASVIGLTGETADADLRAEYYLRDRFWCEYGVNAGSIQRSDRGLAYDSGVNVDTWASHLGLGITFTGTTPFATSASTDPDIGGRTSVRSGTGVVELTAGDQGSPVTAVWTGRYVSVADGPIFVASDATAGDRVGFGVVSGNWTVLIRDGGVDANVDTGVAADTEMHTVALYFRTVGEGVSYWVSVDGAILIDGASWGLSLSSDSLSIFACPEVGDESDYKLGRIAFWDEATTYMVKVATWAQRKWARLVQLGEIPGTNLWSNAWHADGIPLGTIASVPPRIGGVPIAPTGSPACINTDFGGRRSLDANGSTQHYSAGGAVATLINGDDVACCGYLHVKADVPANASAFLAWGHTSGSQPAFELRKNASAQLLGRRHGDTGSAVSSSAGGTVPSTESVIVWSYSGTALTVWLNGTKVLDAVALNADALTCNTFGIMAAIRDTVTLRTQGSWRASAVGLGVLSDSLAEYVRARVMGH